MNPRILKFILFALLSNPFNLYSQISITEIEQIEEKIVTKPKPLDSLKNWEYKEKLSDNKQYIGHQIYLPPFEDSKEIINNSYTDIKPFMYSTLPNIIIIDTTEKNLMIKKSWHQSSYYTSGWKSIYYDKIYTIVYKPNYYKGMISDRSYEDLEIGISNKSSEVSNRYYRIIDVIYGDKCQNTLRMLDSILGQKRDEISTISDEYHYSLKKDFNSQLWEKNQNKIFVHYCKELQHNNFNHNILFLVKDEKNGDTIICRDTRRFVLVPHFVKLKNTYENKTFLYGPEKDGSGSYLRYNKIESDPRINIKSEDKYGNEIYKNKEVIVEPGSKWMCISVTLLKPSYDITYILKNDKDEQIALKNLNGFIEESMYIKIESDKKLKQEQIMARVKLEKLQREENEKMEIEKHKVECINLFGQQNGTLIAQGNVKINMTIDMCRYAWGNPLWSNKTTTEYRTVEDWYYGLGYSLHFENGLLKRIEE